MCCLSRWACAGERLFYIMTIITDPDFHRGFIILIMLFSLAILFFWRVFLFVRAIGFYKKHDEK